MTLATNVLRMTLATNVLQTQTLVAEPIGFEVTVAWLPDWD